MTSVRRAKEFGKKLEELGIKPEDLKQFYDKGLAHGSYAIISNGEAALVDPARDPQPYLDYVKEHNAKVVAIFETHPHADFVSSHLEFHTKFGATIYINADADAEEARSRYMARKNEGKKP